MLNANQLNKQLWQQLPLMQWRQKPLTLTYPKAESGAYVNMQTATEPYQNQHMGIPNTATSTNAEIGVKNHDENSAANVQDTREQLT